MILVMEHRAAMSAIMDREHPEAAPEAQLREVKLDIVTRIASSETAISLKTTFISAIKGQKYLVASYSRQTTWLERWGIEKAKKIGTHLVLAARVSWAQSKEQKP